jgi:hypothetical protein
MSTETIVIGSSMDVDCYCGRGAEYIVAPVDEDGFRCGGNTVLLLCGFCKAQYDRVNSEIAMSDRVVLWPNPGDPCYDCGSTIPDHHTPSCEFGPDGCIRDLPERPGTQHWTHEIPENP